jgi:hypothetical protein
MLFTDLSGGFWDGVSPRQQVPGAKFQCARRNWKSSIHSPSQTRRSAAFAAALGGKSGCASRRGARPYDPEQTLRHPRQQAVDASKQKKPRMVMPFANESTHGSGRLRKRQGVARYW